MRHSPAALSPGTNVAAGDAISVGLRTPQWLEQRYVDSMFVARKARS
jgi:hypothetical protein